MKKFALFVSALLVAVACRERAAAGTETRGTATQPPAAAKESTAMKITSPVFEDHKSIPPKYTCDGTDTIPPLKFDGVPAGAKSLALVVDDPDAPRGTWDHWVMWNIPATAQGVDEGRAPDGTAGKNSWGKNAWGGPCPPDREHRYFFKLYALDAMLNLPQSAGKKELESAMQGHTVAQAELVGLYNRKR